jgi:hypothetical protein
MSDDRLAFTVRIAPLHYEALRAYAHYTEQPMGAVVASVVEEFLTANFDDDFVAMVQETRARVRARLAAFQQQ